MKISLKKYKNIIIVLILMCIFIFSGVFDIISYAELAQDPTSTDYKGNQKVVDYEGNKIDGNGGDVAGEITLDAALAALYVGTNGMALILLYAIKAVIIIVGYLLQAIVSGVVGDFGIEGIIFSGATGYADGNILDINIFNNVGTKGTLGEFSSAVAKWYYILRFISVAILLVILVYIGIRMALSTIGQEQAKYKKWLVNWVVSLALLFLLHYIMVMIFTINKALIEVLVSTINTRTELHLQQCSVI